MVKIVEKMIAKGLPEKVANLEALANGIMVQEATKDGVVVYAVPPDRQSNTYLIDRILGKSKERTDETVNHEGELTINVKYDNANDRPDTPPTAS
jgi:hypothetical protein